MKFAWLCSHESYQPEDLVEQAVAAEEAGFDRSEERRVGKEC